MDVASYLVDTGAYKVLIRRPRKEWLKWKSGIIAPVYCNCRELNGFPEERIAISRIMSDAARRRFADVDVIVGTSTAGIAWGRYVSDELGLPFAYVRACAKTHGTGTLVEGYLPKGAKALIIDDLVASGSSVAFVSATLKSEADVAAIGVLSIVNWGFPAMRKNLADLQVVALTSYREVLCGAYLARLINPHELAQLLQFYMCPTDHQWSEPNI
jgi:orotate phosphoribosyltransferase